MKKKLPYIFILALTVLMISSPDRSILYAKRALGLCYEILIPSLFPFFVCSGLLIYSGFAGSLSALLGPVMKPLFNVGGSGAAAFVLGILSGYPLGAVTACQLYESGYLSKSETERLLAFCNNSGPLFILGAVGTAIYASPKIGLMLYASHILAALTVGVLFRFYAMNRHSAPDYTVTQPEISFSEAFSRTLSNSVSSILTICGSVVFFSVVSGIAADFLPPENLARPLLMGFMELTGGISAISSAHLSLAAKLVLSALAAGFAGVCVHLQTMSVVASKNLSLKPYIMGKLLHGILAALYTLCLLKAFPRTAFTYSSGGIDAGFCMSSVYTAAAVIFLVLLGAIITVLSVEYRKQKNGCC